MSTGKSKLDQLKVVTPCSSSWEQMTGNRQKRFCSECNKNVFDFSQMTRNQVEAVVSAHKGQLCGRILRDASGSLVTLEPTPLATISSRRVSPALSAAVAVMIGISLPMQTTVALASPFEASADKEAGRKRTPKPLGSGDVTFAGTTITPQSQPIPDATVKLISSLGEERQTKSSTDGEFLFAQIPAGVYLLLIEAEGFTTYLSHNLTFDAGSKEQMDVVVQPDQRSFIAGGIGGARPQTLLSLYEQSELIVVADVGQTVIAQTDGEAKMLKSALRVTSLVKGDGNVASIPVFHWTYSDMPAQIKTGERRLFFLSRRQSSDEGKLLDGYELAGWDKAARLLDDTTTAVYLQQFEELKAILQKKNSGQFNPAEITDWLVRLAENPVTRWDGVHHLLESSWRAKSLGEDAQRKPDSTDEPANAEQEQASEATPEEKEAIAAEEASEKEMAKLAESLTPAHKTRLADLLFSIKQLSEPDFELVALVSDFSDERLLPYLLSQLRLVANDAPQMAETLVSVIAEVANDDDLKNFANFYGNRSSYDESEFNDESDEQQQKSDRTVGATIAIAKRSTELKKFMTLAEYKLRR